MLLTHLILMLMKCFFCVGANWLIGSAGSLLKKGKKCKENKTWMAVVLLLKQRVPLSYDACNADSQSKQYIFSILQGNCKAVADEYIECEVMILVIDLILHKAKAYRHLFYNMFCKETVNFESLLWKLVLAYLILDIYRMWVLSTNEKEWHSPASVASLLLEFGKMLTGVIFGNIAFLYVVFHASRKFLSASAGFYGWTHILLVILVSSYFKIFLMAMMVWEFPSSVIFIIDIFVLSSNTVALKVITNSVMMRCLAVCAVAHCVKFVASQNKAFVL